ncbi:TetR/AcrR family transcriptional regulator [Kribbella sp.]|uniref:TetR/AcrR family transcriptional regulator n=1 Tax=Kribbella sp. TaxID=1871183 RepID=UPI002D7503F9|nr:TetR/AcrR family transcriptional regulator [Kribbella sp.]HZX01497.1 TetR/AcrR family transcriptional regulator [Kribbella sp.]
MSRKKREDAQANAAGIVRAAEELLAGGADPSMADIAARAGVSRQTLYAHFDRRTDLFDQLVDRLTREVASHLTGTALPDEPRAAIAEWAARCWRVIEANPALLNPALFAHRDGGADPAAHDPITGGLRQALRSAADAQLLAPAATVDWLVTAVLAIGHAAAGELTAGRMTAAAAGAAFEDSVVRLCLS